VPLREEVDVLGLEFNEIGLLVKSGKGEALLWFDNKLNELMFIKLELIEPAPEPDSLLGLA
jgi:hypothetical protein